MKDCFILPLRNVAYSTTDYSHVYLRNNKFGEIRYQINTATEELQDYADLKEYGYYVKGSAKRSSEFFVCEVERVNFYV